MHIDISERINEVSQSLRQQFGEPPRLAVVLGSGLSGVADQLEAAHRLPRTELGLMAPGVAGHSGHVVVGNLGGHRVLALCGRLHLYEGHPVSEVVLAVRALAAWGVKFLVLTSAVGGIRPGLRPGDVVRVRDHINLSGVNPLRGPLPVGTQSRFLDVSHLYSSRLRALLPHLPEGVYAAMPGPSYETPAEIRMLSVMGADLVGMSMVHEAIAALHGGMEVLSLSVVSNAAAGLSDDPLDHHDVTAVTARATQTIYNALLTVVQGC